MTTSKHPIPRSESTDARPIAWRWPVEIAQWLILAAMFVAAALLWGEAPERMPVHWNAAGEVDRHGSRFEGLLLLPLIALGLYALLLFLPRLDPGRANYRQFRTVYDVIRIATLVVMAVVYSFMLLAMKGRDVPMSLLVPLLVGGLFVVLGSVLGKVRPNWFVGVRTPWTLSSKTAWVKTHRVAGWTFIAMGLGTMACGWLPPPVNVGVLVGVTVLGSFGVVVYSYLVWRDADDKQPPAGTSPADNP